MIERENTDDEASLMSGERVAVELTPPAKDSADGNEAFQTALDFHCSDWPDVNRQFQHSADDRFSLTSRVRELEDELLIMKYLNRSVNGRTWKPKEKYGSYL